MPDRDALHSDINCCYAQIECQARPELRGKPVVVGGDEEARHGIVLAKNLIAKRAGVKTAMALWEARKACPGLVVVPLTTGSTWTCRGEPGRSTTITPTV